MSILFAYLSVYSFALSQHYNYISLSCVKHFQSSTLHLQINRRWIVCSLPSNKLFNNEYESIISIQCDTFRAYSLLLIFFPDAFYHINTHFKTSSSVLFTWACYDVAGDRVRLSCGWWTSDWNWAIIIETHCFICKHDFIFPF